MPRRHLRRCEGGLDPGRRDPAVTWAHPGTGTMDDARRGTYKLGLLRHTEPGRRYRRHRRRSPASRLGSYITRTRCTSEPVIVNCRSPDPAAGQEDDGCRCPRAAVATSSTVTVATATLTPRCSRPPTRHKEISDGWIPVPVDPRRQEQWRQEQRQARLVRAAVGAMPIVGAAAGSPATARVKLSGARGRPRHPRLRRWSVTRAAGAATGVSARLRQPGALKALTREDV